ncbi:MAG: hypothetical protein LBE02_02580, partial [Spirochaetaceae bacterium]|nr:hypothetical protein [Spirochaetaceae bacterium]
MTITVSAAVILRAGTITLTGNSTAGTVTISGGTLALGSYGLTATGTISNTGTITAGGGALESSGGSVSGTGVISGTSLVVSAAIGIDLSGANTIDSVSLINTTSGPIVYNGEVSGGLTAAANNGGTGAITIRNTGGDLTVGSGGISGGGAVNISTATSGGIVINDGIDGSTVNVSAAGGISGTGGIAAGTTVSLTANSGSVSEGGVVSGTSLTVNAAAGISLGGANTIGSVSLINTTNGSIVYNGAVSGGLTATGGNTGGGSIAITNTGGNLTVGTGGISGGGAVTLSTPDNYGITIDGVINGIERLALKAGTSASSTGNVAISAAVSVTGSGAGHIEAASAVYVWAHDMTGGGGITPGTGQACLWVDQHPSYSGAVAGGRVHIHPRNGGHVVYRNGVDAPAAHGVSPPYFYIDSSSAALPTTLVYHLAAGNNAYIIDVGTRNRAVTFTCSGTGFIEIRGAYQSNAALTLTPGTGGVRLANSDATPADPGVVNLTASAFTLPAGTNLELRGGTGTPASITAADITLGGGITGTASEANNLVLNAGIGALSVTGAVGSTGTKLGDISVAAGTGGAVSFSSTINAKSYTQTGAGSATFGAAQNYTKAFSFTGTNLTVNSSLRTDSDSTNDDGPFSFTGAGFALNGALTTGSGSIGAANTVTINNTGAFTTSAGTGAISAGGAFSQTGTTGTVSIGAGITTRNSTDTDAAISFADAVSIAPANNGTVTFNSNAGNGPITLSGAVNSAGTNRSLTLNSGAGIVTLSNTVSLTGSFTKSGAGRTILNNNITSNSANSGNNYGISFAGDIELGRNITLSTGTGGGNITISGLVDGYTSSTRRNLTLTAGTGTISVTGVVGHDGATESSTIRLGILKVTSAANVSFGGAVWAVSFDQSNAAGTGSGGSGLTAFNGAQDYTGGFKFIGTNLTVNNTLATDTDT